MLLLAAPACLSAAEPAGRLDVLTAHADRQRTGWFSKESQLTPAALASGKVAKLWESPAFDGYGEYPARLYASPLYVDGLTLTDGPNAGKTFRVVIAATSTGDVYAINAGAASGVAPGAILWKTRLDPNDAPCVLGWDRSTMGVMGTPIVDKARATLYVASCSVGAGFRIYALNLASGKIEAGWPVAVDEATLARPEYNRNPRYDSAPPPPAPRRGRFSIQRGALNLSPDDRYLYMTIGQGRGWVVAVDTKSKTLLSSFSATPLEEDSVGGIWSPTGVSVGSRGEVYAVTGASGGQRSAPPLRNWSQSVLRFDPPTSAGLSLSGVYTPFNYCRAAAEDIDLGSSGATIIPDPPGRKSNDGPLLAVAGKQGNAYLLGKSSLTAPGQERRSCSEDSETDLSLLSPDPQPQFGKRGPINVFGPYADADGMLDRAKNRATPAYYRDAAGREFLFYSGNTKDPADTRVAIAPGIVRMRLTRPASGSPYMKIDGRAMDFVLKNPGPAVVSSNGSRDALLWVLDEDAARSTPLTGPNAPKPILYAIDPATLKVVWKTESGVLQTSGKYNSPIIAKGNVYVGTDRIVAFGLK